MVRGEKCHPWESISLLFLLLIIVRNLKLRMRVAFRLRRFTAFSLYQWIYEWPSISLETWQGNTLLKRSSFIFIHTSSYFLDFRTELFSLNKSLHLDRCVTWLVSIQRSSRYVPQRTSELVVSKNPSSFSTRATPWGQPGFSTNDQREWSWSPFSVWWIVLCTYAAGRVTLPLHPI